MITLQDLSTIPSWGSKMLLCARLEFETMQPPQKTACLKRNKDEQKQMDPHRLQAFMKGSAREFTTSLPAQMKESALKLLETTWQTPSVLHMATHKCQHCFCGWTVCIMRSQCANSAIISWLASFLAAQMDQQTRSFGKIVPSGPWRVTCFFHCRVISVFLIDLYHLRWCDRTQTHSSQIPSEDSSAKQFSRSCVWSIFPPQAPTEVSFLPTASLLLAGREARSRCSIKWQQFRKVDWTWLSDGPARQWWALRKVVHPKILGGGHLSFHLNVGNAYCQKEFPIPGVLNSCYSWSFAVRLNIIISLAAENKGLFMSLVRLTKSCYGCARTNTGHAWYKMQIHWFDSACQSQFMNREISELWMPAKLELLF